MPTDITYRGDERVAEFQVVAEDGVTPVAWASVLGLILVIYYQKERVLMRFSKNVMANWTTITNVTDAPNGIFEIFIPSEITSPADPSRNLNWEAKVTIANADSPDGKQDMITQGIITQLDDSITRNMPTE